MPRRALTVAFVVLLAGAWYAQPSRVGACALYWPTAVDDSNLIVVGRFSIAAAPTVDIAVDRYLKGDGDTTLSAQIPGPCPSVQTGYGIAGLTRREDGSLVITPNRLASVGRPAGSFEVQALIEQVQEHLRAPLVRPPQVGHGDSHRTRPPLVAQSAALLILLALSILARRRMIVSELPGL